MSDNTINSTHSSIALQKGLYAQDEAGHYHLLACHCAVCELTFFPQRKYCGKCGSSEMASSNLSRRGTVYSFSLIDRKSKVAIIEPPYLQIEVEMPEGVHVFSVLDQCDLDAVQIGMEVEVYVGTVKQDEDGNDVLTYKFKPVAAAQPAAH
jgi:uncharacterized OB-fold protein